MADLPLFRLTNTMTRRLEPLEPTERTADGRPLLRFYSCGPTVYSYAHIGNFRTFLTADLVVRTARALGWDVRYVSNVTDVGHLTEDDLADGGGEDKMAKALASKEGERFANIWDLARHYTDALVADWEALGLVEPDVRPRATEHVREQIRAVEQLLASGHAYETADGVYFHVPSFPAYGALSGNADADALIENTRDTVRDDGKRDPRDFALWKKDDAHLMQWHSPFAAGGGSGWGFPGWHLECSVMAQQYLGTTIDLHGGGEDLRFPHHECEIAQAEALTGEPFARMWIHTRFLQVEGEKMSKSRGNFLTVRDLTQPDGRADWGAPVDPLAVRLVLLSGHYSKPFNLTKKALEDAAKNAARYRDARRSAGADAAPGEATSLGTDLASDYNAALAAMADDLNTPVALASAYRGAGRIVQAARAGLSAPDADAARGFLDRIDDLLGIAPPGAPASPADDADDGLAAEVERLLADRADARASKDWPRADTIRDALAALGVEVTDTSAGPVWTRR